MSKALSIFDSPKLSVPSHVAGFLKEESNIADRVTVPSLGYEGKVWTISLNGEKTKLMKRNDDGDEEAVAIFRAIILDYGKRRGRAYYEGAYDPAKPGTPLCWSDDGVGPHADVKDPQGKTCATCPMAAKGSKVTEQGKSITACSQHRMVALVPAAKPDSQPLRLKLAITSDYDGNSPELQAQGWYAFSNYTDMLRTKGVTHTAAIVTKMRFDPNVAYPKVLFSPDKWTDDATLKSLIPTIKSDEIKSLLAGTWTPAGVDGAKLVDAPDEFEEPAPKKAAKKPVVLDDEDEVEVTPPPKKAKAEPAPVKKAPVVIDMDDDEDEPAPPKKAKKAEPAKAEKSVSDDVDDLLTEWGAD